MTFSVSAIVLDIVLVAILVFTAISYTHKGFLSGIVKLLGSLVSIIVSMLAASKVSPILFDRFFREGLISRTQQTITQQGVPYLEGLVEDIASFLPIDFVRDIVEQATQAIDTQSSSLAQDIVEMTFKPLFVPLIAVILFFILYAVCRIIISQLSAALINVNKIPLVGGVNKALGLITGILCGILEILIVLCAVWAIITLTNNGIPYINSEQLSTSFFYSMFNGVNPFLKL